MKIQNILLGLAFGVAALGLFLPFAPSVLPIGGVTNYDSLQLQPEVSGDNALDVRNSAGTSRMVVDGNGNITLSGTTTVSGASTLSGTITFSGLIDASLEADFAARVIEGGIITTITSTGNIALTAAQVCDSSLIDVSEGDTQNLTFPAFSGIITDCMDSNADMIKFLVSNTNTAAASTYTLVAGASTTMLEVDGGNVIIAGLNHVWINLIRKSATELIMATSEMQDAD